MLIQVTRVQEFLVSVVPRVQELFSLAWDAFQRRTVPPAPVERPPLTGWRR